MENEKKIQIKIEGNKCTINYPDESQMIKSKISGQSSLCGSFGNIDDLTLTISKATDDFINNNTNNIIKKTNSSKIINSNEKSKLEITYISIFNSDKKSENTSNIKTPLYQINNKNKNEINNDISNKNIEKELKDSVIKKLNFDLCDSIKETETIKKNQEPEQIPFTKNISKNLNERYFIHEKNVNNNINNNEITKSNNLITNSFENVTKDESNNEKYITVNKSFKFFKNRCKSFHKGKKNNNRISVDSNASSKNNQNNIINQDNSKNISLNIKNNLFQNNSSSKIHVNKSHFIKNEILNDNIQNNEFNKFLEKKEKLKKYFDKLSESKTSLKSKYLKLKQGNNLIKFKKDQNLNQLIKVEENLDTEERININNSNKDYIMKTNKKLFPQLSSANSFNTSNSKNKLNMAQLSTIKKSYYFQTPSTNIRGGNDTTSTKKGSFSSNLNSPIISISSSKMGIGSRIDKKDLITKLYYNNSSSKNIIQKNKNENITNSKLDKRNNDIIIDREKEVVKYLLKKHNTDLKNVMKINNKKIQTILNGKNFNFGNNNNGNKKNEINEFKQFIQKNQFDKELLKTIKKRGSFH